MTQLDLFDYCAQCGTEHPPNPDLEQEIFRGGEKPTKYHFCSQLCKEHFAQRQFRQNQTC